MYELENVRFEWLLDCHRTLFKGLLDSPQQQSWCWRCAPGPRRSRAIASAQEGINSKGNIIDNTLVTGQDEK